MDIIEILREKVDRIDIMLTDPLLSQADRDNLIRTQRINKINLHNCLNPHDKIEFTNDDLMHLVYLKGVADSYFKANSHVE